MYRRPDARMGRRPCRTGQRGLTLIEILVTLVILSIGMLGLAGLQAATSKYKINSWARSASSLLIADFGDRVRANYEADANDFLTNRDGKSPYVIGTTWDDQQGDVADPAKDCAAESCSPNERADYDRAQWLKRVRELMPGGSAFVAGDRSLGFDVTLMWFDKNHVDAATGELIEPTVCTGDETGLAYQSCCPVGAGAPEGVRCLTARVLP